MNIECVKTYLNIYSCKIKLNNKKKAVRIYLVKVLNMHKGYVIQFVIDTLDKDQTWWNYISVMKVNCWHVNMQSLSKCIIFFHIFLTGTSKWNDHDYFNAHVDKIEVNEPKPCHNITKLMDVYKTQCDFVDTRNSKVSLHKRKIPWQVLVANTVELPTGIVAR